jgi:RimJ/RimL family protein N-acetyltransferase
MYAAAPSSSPVAPSAQGLRLRDAAAPLLRPPDAAIAALASPAMARAWAEALVMHWSRVERLGGIDLSQPLYVIDLAPGDGGLALGVLDGLRDEMHARGMVGWPVRYLLCPLAATHGTDVDPMAQARLREHADRGWLQQASWQPRTGHPLLLGTSRFPLFGARNPVAALAAGSLSCLPADLYAVHFGALFEACISSEESSSGGDAEVALQCDWRPVAPDAPEPAVAKLLEHYRHAFNSVPLLLSEPLLALADALGDFSAGRYLLLAADRGVATNDQVRRHAMALPAQALAGELELPVNFHALAMHQQGHGARTADVQRDEMDVVLHVACSEDRVGLDDASWRSLLACADRGHPSQRWWWSREEQPAESLDDVNFMLHGSSHDPWVLARLLQDGNALTRWASEAGDTALSEARTNLRMAWANLEANRWGPAQRLAYATLQAQLRNWPALREALEGAGAPDAHFDLLRARLELATGRTAAASASLRQRMRQGEATEEAKRLYRLVRLRLRRWRHSRWHLEGSPAHGELSFELLDNLHIDDWLHQYRDPHIARLTGLPALRTPTEAEAYLREVAEVGGAEYAIVHAQLGLIGCAGVRGTGDAAHIHYWIGNDHQGQGWGTSAVRLFVQLLTRQGVAHLFTSIHRHNLRSCRVLESAGFLPLPGDLQTDADFTFVHAPLVQGMPLPAAALRARLAAVCELIGEPLPKE